MSFEQLSNQPQPPWTVLNPNARSLSPVSVPPSGGGGSGVSSLAGLTGALTLGSSDSSVTITPSGTNIDLKSTGGGGGSGTTISFSSTASYTAWNPSALASPSNAYSSTSTYTLPSLPGVLRLRALLTASSTSCAGINIGVANATRMIAIGVGENGYAGGNDCTISGSSYSSFLPNYFNIGYSVGTSYEVELVLAINSSTSVSIGGTCMGQSLGTLHVTDLDFSGTLTFYAIGDVVTDVTAAMYSHTLF